MIGTQKLRKSKVIEPEFEGVFLRQTKSSDDSCFVFPTNEDHCVFGLKQVIGAVNEPTMLR